MKDNKFGDKMFDNILKKSRQMLIQCPKNNGQG